MELVPHANSDSTALSSRDSILPKSPNVDEITDLARRIREITDLLSRLLLKEIEWKKGLSSEQRRLLDSSVDKFRNFCDDAKALLQIFFNFSRQITALFSSIFDPECSGDIRSYANALQSKLENTSAQIASVEQQYTTFTSQLRDLMEIAPHSVRPCTQAIGQDHGVFQRLDAFWKVIATQLASLLERRSQLPHPDIIRDLKHRWQEYQGYLIGAMDVLGQPSDALEASTVEAEVQKSSLSNYVKRGLSAFWSKLTRRRTKSHSQGNSSISAKRPSRFLTGRAARKRLMVRVREQPVNFMIIVNQSLMTAQNGQSRCRAGSRAVKILLGESNGEDPEWDRTKFVTTTFEEIKKSASDLNKDTNGIKDKFGLLRALVLDLRKELNSVTGGEEQSNFFSRLSRILNKDVGNCEIVLRKVHDDLNGIENSLDLITSWWQKLESDAEYLQMNGGALLEILRNRITLKSIADSFTTLEKDLADYLHKMSSLFDENIVYLNDESKEYVAMVRDCPDLKFSMNGRLEPGSK